MSSEIISCMGQDTAFPEAKQQKIEDIEFEIECLNTLVGKLIERIEKVEADQKTATQLITGGTTKAAERAIILNEAVRQKGYLQRGEVIKLIKCCHSEALRAMNETASMFDDVFVVKNSRKRWVLAVREEQ